MFKNSKASLLMRGSFLRVITLLANVIATFFLMPYIIHALGDRWYGMWALVGTIMGYHSLLDLGLAQATRRFIAFASGQGDQERIGKVLNTSLGILCLVGVVSLCISGIIALLAPLWLASTEEVSVFRYVVMIAGVNLLITFAFTVFPAALEAHLRFDLVSIIRIFNVIIRTTLILVFVSNGGGIMYIALAVLISNMAFQLTIATIAIRNLKGISINLSQFSIKDAKELFNFGKYSFLGTVGDVLRFQVDNLVIARFLTLSVVTHYNIAIRLVDYVGQLIVNAIGILTPVFTTYHAQGDTKKLREIFFMSTRLAIVAAASFQGGVLIFGYAFIERWMGVGYTDAYIPMAILCISGVFALGQNPSVSYLNAIAKHRFYAWTTIAEAVANVSLSLILVTRYGMIGVALGTAIPMLITKMFILPWYVCKQIQSPLLKYYKEFAFYLLVTALLQIPALLLSLKLQPTTYIGMFSLAGLYYTLLAVILYRFVLPGSDRQYFIDAIPILKRLE